MADTDLPKREEIEGDTMNDKMMRLVLSLRAELYELYARHQAVMDENLRLRARGTAVIKLRESEAKPNEETSPEDNAVSVGAARKDEHVLGGEREDREEALTLPTAESESRAADEGVVSGDAAGKVRADTPVPNSPKFPLQPVEFRPEQGDLRPVSPSEHGLQAPPPLAPALVGSSSICCMSPPPNAESDQP